MLVWVCNSCHAEITGEKPTMCPLCAQDNRGFEEGERTDKQDPEEKKYSDIYKDIINQLEAYDEGCEPQKIEFCSYHGSE